MYKISIKISKKPVINEIIKKPFKNCIPKTPLWKKKNLIRSHTYNKKINVKSEAYPKIFNLHHLGKTSD